MRATTPRMVADTATSVARWADRFVTEIARAVSEGGDVARRPTPSSLLLIWIEEFSALRAKTPPAGVTSGVCDRRCWTTSRAYLSRDASWLARTT